MGAHLDDKGWTYRFTEAIPVGADVSNVDIKFRVWLLRIILGDGQIEKFAGRVIAALSQTCDILDNWAATGKRDSDAALKATNAAWIAQDSAQLASELAGLAAFSMSSQAETAEMVVWLAAGTFIYLRPESYSLIADKLVELLRNA